MTTTGTPAVYETLVQHVRTTPLRHAFRNRSAWWLVDLDALPRLPRVLAPLARFETRDHLLTADADPRAGLRDVVDAFCAERGTDLTGGRVLMLTSPRSLGHVFNPLSVFWCYSADGTLACVLAEVQNTYGGRHTYLVETDERGRAEVGKRFYVSPFNPVDGHYTMRLPEPGEHLDLAVTLHRPGQRPFVATVRGDRHDATTARVVRTALRHPSETRLVALRIRVQGVALWLKRLPVVARSAGDSATTASPDPAVTLTRQQEDAA